MKYIYCILFSVLLFGGIYEIPTLDQQESGTQTEATNIQPATQSYYCISTAVSSQSPSNDNHIFNDRTANCNINDILSGNLSTLRNTVPSKTLKFNATHIVMQLLSSMNSPRPDNKSGSNSPDTNYTKYSNKYYVYTLGHILI